MSENESSLLRKAWDLLPKIKKASDNLRSTITSTVDWLIDKPFSYLAATAGAAAGLGTGWTLAIALGAGLPVAVLAAAIGLIIGTVVGIGATRDPDVEDSLSDKHAKERLLETVREELKQIFNEINKLEAKNAPRDVIERKWENYKKLDDYRTNLVQIDARDISRKVSKRTSVDAELEARNQEYETLMKSALAVDDSVEGKLEQQSRDRT